MRRLPPLAALLLTVACTGTIDFELKRQFSVDATASAIAPVERYVDVAQSAPQVWNRRTAVTSLEVHSADLVVTPGVGNAATRIVSGAMKLRLDCTGNPILFASLANVSLASGATVALAPTAEGTKALDDALKGSGKICWTLEGETDAAPVRFTADATIRMSVGYKL